MVDAAVGVEDSIVKVRTRGGEGHNSRKRPCWVAQHATGSMAMCGFKETPANAHLMQVDH